MAWTPGARRRLDLDEQARRDEELGRDQRRALDCHDRAASLLRSAVVVPDLVGIGTELREGRYYLACARARRDGDELPARRDPCFFNPMHGPASRDLLWTPPEGVERQVAVCNADAERLGDGTRPDVRMVRIGDAYVPWWAASAGTDTRSLKQQAMRDGYRYAEVEVGVAAIRAVATSPWS